ncbi:type IV secretion system protein VirB6 [Crenobacter luteus]|uniref:type IV secretion system protein n=1 Tax=Crenobacter luteus TaxID=1452487 RepID=UPI00104DD64A|nr:type IV secretion system protein [Crenobacter luteus]TCP11780.1 type IV secretion system protein VirB6 [Crenobacter luteus]
MPDWTLFTFIGETVTNATNAFVVPAAADLIYKLQMTALLGVTLYFVLTGYAIATGSIEAPFPTFIKQCVKIVIIASFALTADGYHAHVVETFQGLETGLSSVLDASSATPPTSIYETLDGVLNKGATMASTCLDHALEAGWNIGAAVSWVLAAVFISLGTLAFALVGGVNIIMAKFALAILFALGPLFILALMFPVTSKFFDSWMGQVLNYTFTVVILALIMSFGIVAFDHFVASANLSGDGQQHPFMVGLQVLGLTVALTFIAKQATGIAAGLAGGVSMAALGLRQILAPAKPLADAVNPLAQRTKLDPRTGLQTTSSRAEHFMMGRTMWNPAYKQAVKEHMQSNWGRANGGSLKRG